MCVQHLWRHRYRCRPLGVASALFPLSANQIYLMLVVWNGTKDVDLGSKQIEQHRRVGLGLRPSHIASDAFQADLLRFPRPGFGQAVAGSAGLNQSVICRW